MTETTEAVPLDSIEEIDEDPPPEPPELDQAANEMGNVDVDPSTLEMGTVDPTRGPTAPKPPTMGVVTPPAPPPPLGYKEPWVSFDTTPEGEGETPPDLEAIKRYFAELKDKLTLQISDIEKQLGFITEAADLAVRVAKIEAFLGIKTG